ncbi:MAG: hypothetical protein RIS09_225 [Actinomycetota bacterium]
MKNQSDQTPNLKESQRLFSEALRRTLRFKRNFFSSRIQVPEIDTSPVFESSFDLGYATAREGDAFSYTNRDGFGGTVAAGISIIQEDLGKKANLAYADGMKHAGNAESNVRANGSSLPFWFIPTILATTVLIDSVAAHRALSEVWDATEFVTWLAAGAIALLLAIAGWMIAVSGVRILGSAALWIGLILSVIAVIGVGWTAAELRGADQSKESLKEQLDQIRLLQSEDFSENGADTALSNERLTIIENQLIEVNNKFDTYVLYFYIVLILFTVSVASLSKAYETLQQEQVFDKRTNRRQFLRGKSLAKAESEIEKLEAWLPVSTSIQKLGEMALARYVDGFRMGLSPEQLDNFVSNPPKLVEISAPSWVDIFRDKLEAQRNRLHTYKEDMEIPSTR